MHTTRLVTLLLAGLLVASLAAPAAAQSDDDEKRVEDLDALAATYNENLDSVPGIFVSRLANERVDIRVTTGDGHRQYYADTGDDARIEAIERGTGDRKPTVRVRTDESTLDAIRTAERPAATAVEAYNAGAIEIEGVGIVGAVEVETAKAALGIGRFLGLV